MGGNTSQGLRWDERQKRRPNGVRNAKTKKTGKREEARLSEQKKQNEKGVVGGECQGT